MPLKRLKNQFLEGDGVRFAMRDDAMLVRCVVPHEALRLLASLGEAHGTDGDVFEAYRDLVERLASEAYDADAPFDRRGRIVVTRRAIEERYAEFCGRWKHMQSGQRSR